MLQDITEAQARQHEERQAHRLSARLLAISADAVLTTNAQLVISHANPAAERLFGYGPGALNGTPLAALLPERYRSEHASHIERFAREAQPARLMGERSEIIGLARTGEEIPLEASISKLTMEQETVFSAQLRDLRAWKARQRELEQTLASLDLVFEHARQAMALIDAEGQVTQMNAAARALLPQDADPIGASFCELPFWSDDPAATREALVSALSQALSGATYRLDTEVQYPNGERVRVDFSLTPVMRDGTAFAVIAEARDLLATDSA